MMNFDKTKRGQSTVEYVVLFTVVCGVVILATFAMIKPALNDLYNRTADSLAHINTQVP